MARLVPLTLTICDGQRRIKTFPIDHPQKRPLHDDIKVSGPLLRVSIFPSSDGYEITRATVDISDQEFSHHQRFDSDEDIGSLGFTLMGEEEETLVDKLNSLIGELSKEDRHRLVAQYEFLGEPISESSQKMLFITVVNILLYLAGVTVLAQEEIWNHLPFRFTLPWGKITAPNILTQSALQYLSSPLQALTQCALDPSESSHSVAFQLVHQLTEFINIWSLFFDEGPTLDTHRALLDTLSGYAQATIGHFARLGTRRQEYDSQIQRALHQIDETKRWAIREIDTTLEKRIEKSLEKSLEGWSSKLDGLVASKVEEELTRRSGKKEDSESSSEASDTPTPSITPIHPGRNHNNSFRRLETQMQDLSSRVNGTYDPFNLHTLEKRIQKLESSYCECKK